jgi:RNA polymerase sigma-70 factor, ECF subfamily
MSGGSPDAAERHRWFEPLARALERPAFHFAVMLIRDRAIAEELVQEAFARVWLSKNTPTAEADFRRWLYRVIINLARDHQRRRSLESRVRFWEPRSIDPIELVARRAEDRELLRSLLTLPPKDREAIYLHYVEGQPFAEIGQVLGVSETAARVRVHRALQKLRRQLGPDACPQEVPA